MTADHARLFALETRLARLSVEDLAVSRGGAMIVEGVSFSARGGDMVEVIGPNGSGKSSLLRALAGVVRPERGRIRWERSSDLQTQGGAPKARLSYLAHEPGLRASRRLDAELRYWRSLKGGGGATKTAMAAVGLVAESRTPVRKLSAGQKRRAALARLLVEARPLWILDEPLAALDTDGSELVRRLIASYRGEGGLVVAATHHALATDSIRLAIARPEAA